MSAADLVAQLAEAGTPPALLAAVAKELFAGEAERAALAERRKNERERKARSRDNTGQDVTARDVTGSHDAAPSLNKESPQTPKKLNPSPCVQTPRARGDYHRLPEGWKPTRPLPPKSQAKVDEWPPGAIEEELAAMHRWAKNAKNEAGKGRKLDWDAAWINWLERRHDERYSRKSGTNGMGRHQPGGEARIVAAGRSFVSRGAGGSVEGSPRPDPGQP